MASFGNLIRRLRGSFSSNTIASIEKEVEAEDEYIATELSPNNEVWQYSKQYSVINSEGGHKPPPSFGSPTLVWHLGIWQRFDADEAETAPNDGVLKSRFNHFDDHNTKFFDEIRQFIEHLQKRGRVLDLDGDGIPDLGFETLNYCKPAGLNPDTLEEGRRTFTHPFCVCEPQSLGFTLWWQDADAFGGPVLNEREFKPACGALRVRVQVQTHVDHVTISFFIDAAKPYGEPQIYTTESKSDEEFGRRRRRIANYLERMREICGNQINFGFVDQDRLPEQLYPRPDPAQYRDSAAYKEALAVHAANEQKAAADLLEISEYFYEGIWKDFFHSFDIKLPMRDVGHGDGHTSQSGSLHIGRQGKIFANFRGLVMSVDGITTDGAVARSAQVEQLRESLNIPQPAVPAACEANTGLGKFPVFDEEAGEPNTVLKSMWPFLRRAMPWADYRDLIGCGLFEWRALYLGAPGASGSFYANQEAPGRLHELPAGSPPEEPQGPHQEWSPMRYMIVTKGEPHREQIGRIVERINALGTMRLFALKNLGVIKNAGTHLRLLGHELDGAIHQWGVERDKIERRYRRLLDRARIEGREGAGWHRQVRNWLEWLRSLWERNISLETVVETGEHRKPKSPAILDVEHARVEELGELIRDTEQRLIQLTSALDKIGRGGAGRILYVINRSNYYCDEFERLWPTLQVGNIDGWITYGRFVERGLSPTFGLIRNTGQRLIALRERLLSITEMIQTSALIIETEATKSNTAQLSRIATNLYFVEVPLVIIAGKFFIEFLGQVFQTTAVTAVGAALIGVYIIYRYFARRRTMRQAPPQTNDNGREPPGPVARR
jgi:hypothetical protein